MLWEKCASCGQMSFHRELENSLRVCPPCGFHMRIAARRRLELLFDDGQFKVIELPAVPLDPLKFRDPKRHTDRLREAQAKNWPDERSAERGVGKEWVKQCRYRWSPHH